MEDLSLQTTLRKGSEEKAIAFAGENPISLGVGAFIVVTNARKL